MSFEKISGYSNEKKELLNLRNMLHEASMFREKGVRIPRGIVLYGEPGIGKTVLARSIADDGISLIELRAANCCTNETEKYIRSCFEKAKESAPCVLLLDELDKIAGTSMDFFMQGNDEVNKILLQELDALSSKDSVLVVATCNNLECLGDALIRPGRFDRLIEMNLPDEKTRKEILKQYLNDITLKKRINLDQIAKITSGFTCAKLECLVNEAGILALENNKNTVTEKDIRLAMNKILFNGSERKPTKNKDELRKIAVHEAGHAVVAMYMRPDALYGASILPQGEASGHVQLFSQSNKAPSVSWVEDNIAILLAGRVAERTILGEMYLGAESDLEKAVSSMMYLISSQAAYGYRFLMNKPSPMNFRSEMSSDSLKMDTAKIMEEKLSSLDKKAEDIINNHRKVFDRVVDALMERQVLCRDELLGIMSLDKAGA